MIERGGDRERRNESYKATERKKGEMMINRRKIRYRVLSGKTDRQTDRKITSLS